MVTIVANEEQNQLEESLLLDLSTLGSSPRRQSAGSTGEKLRFFKIFYSQI